MDDIEATDPNCPNCGTRCRPRGVAWWCYFCGVAVLLSEAL